jgi:hypothetical protein
MQDQKYEAGETRVRIEQLSFSLASASGAAKGKVDTGSPASDQGVYLEFFVQLEIVLRLPWRKFNRNW